MDAPTLSNGRLRLIRDDGSIAEGCIRTNESVLSFGADISNDIRIKVEDAESKMCSIEIDQSLKVKIVNFSKKHPALVNDKEVLKKTILKHGDVITIMNKKFIWENVKKSANDIKGIPASVPAKKSKSIRTLSDNEKLPKRLTVHCQAPDIKQQVPSNIEKHNNTENIAHLTENTEVTPQLTLQSPKDTCFKKLDESNASINNELAINIFSPIDNISASHESQSTHLTPCDAIAKRDKYKSTLLRSVLKSTNHSTGNCLVKSYSNMNNSMPLTTKVPTSNENNSLTPKLNSTLPAKTEWVETILATNDLEQIYSEPNDAIQVRSDRFSDITPTTSKTSHLIQLNSAQSSFEKNNDLPKHSIQSNQIRSTRKKIRQALFSLNNSMSVQLDQSGEEILDIGEEAAKQNIRDSNINSNFDANAELFKSITDSKEEQKSINFEIPEKALYDDQQISEEFQEHCAETETECHTADVSIKLTELGQLNETKNVDNDNDCNVFDFAEDAEQIKPAIETFKGTPMSVSFLRKTTADKDTEEDNAVQVNNDIEITTSTPMSARVLRRAKGDGDTLQASAEVKTSMETPILARVLRKTRAKRNPEDESAVLENADIETATDTPMSTRKTRAKRNPEDESAVLENADIETATGTPMSTRKTRAKRNPEDESAVPANAVIETATGTPMSTRKTRAKRNPEDESAVPANADIETATGTPMSTRKTRAKRNAEGITVQANSEVKNTMETQISARVLRKANVTGDAEDNNPDVEITTETPISARSLRKNKVDEDTQHKNPDIETFVKSPFSARIFRKAKAEKNIETEIEQQKNVDLDSSKTSKSARVLRKTKIDGNRLQKLDINVTSTPEQNFQKLEYNVPQPKLVNSLQKSEQHNKNSNSVDVLFNENTSIQKSYNDVVMVDESQVLETENKAANLQRKISKRGKKLAKANLNQDKQSNLINTTEEQTDKLTLPATSLVTVETVSEESDKPESKPKKRGRKPKVVEKNEKIDIQDSHASIGIQETVKVENGKTSRNLDSELVSVKKSTIRNTKKKLNEKQTFSELEQSTAQETPKDIDILSKNTFKKANLNANKPLKGKRKNNNEEVEKNKTLTQVDVEDIENKQAMAKPGKRNQKRKIHPSVSEDIDPLIAEPRLTRGRKIKLLDNETNGTHLQTAQNIVCSADTDAKETDDKNETVKFSAIQNNQNIANIKLDESKAKKNKKEKKVKDKAPSPQATRTLRSRAKLN